MILAFILIIDLSNLIYFKYSHFMIENAQTLLQLIGKEGLLIVDFSVALPIGISFYTFQIMSYVIDVYKNRVKPQTNLLHLSLYAMMFPQLIAGPIVRYSDITKEIVSRHTDISEIEEGVKRFIIGFAKKIFIANEMGNMADIVFSYSKAGQMNTAYAWLGAICYTFQIYYDFSAYSDMAIGLGRIFGFHFKENFHYPYAANSIQDFWRRWHISLSSWFRDYVYIPLGGNRRGSAVTYRNLAIVFLLTGVWHGAAWHYIAWGIFHAIFILIERAGIGKILKKIPWVFGRLYTLAIVITGWVLFRADNMGCAIKHLKCMFTIQTNYFHNAEVTGLLNRMFMITMMAAIIFSVPVFPKLKNLKVINNSYLSSALYLLLWVASVLYLCGLSYNPFIYFQF